MKNRTSVNRMGILVYAKEKKEFDTFYYHFSNSEVRTDAYVQ